MYDLDLSTYQPSRYLAEARSQARYDAFSLRLGLLAILLIASLYTGALHDLLASMPHPLAILYSKWFFIVLLSLFYVLYKRD